MRGRRAWERAGFARPVPRAPCDGSLACPRPAALHHLAGLPLNPQSNSNSNAPSGVPASQTHPPPPPRPKKSSGRAERRVALSCSCSPTRLARLACCYLAASASQRGERSGAERVGDAVAARPRRPIYRRCRDLTDRGCPGGGHRCRRRRRRRGA